MKTNPYLKLSYKRFQGFTLVELLAVIVIVGILLALIFPIFSKIHRRTQDAKCLANIRTYGTALFAFMSDHGGSLPRWDGLASKDSENTPQFNKWLIGDSTKAVDATGNEYLPRNYTVRCPLADGKAYDNVPSRYRFPYAPNMWICNTFPNLMAGVPAPANRFVLVAEVNDWDGYESYTSLNSAMWIGGTPGQDGEQTNSTRMPIPRYHGEKEHRGLHFFFLDGSAKLVFPTDGDWRKEPVCAPTKGIATTGYFYHSSHYKNLKNGTLIAE